MTKNRLSHIVTKVELIRMSNDANVRGFFNQCCTGLFRFKNCVRERMAKAYLTGLLFPGNKSADGIGARVNVHPDALRHLIHDAPWDAHELLGVMAEAALQAVLRQGREPIAYALDDTTQLKWGSQSPGVARQYSGRYGRTANCQSYPTLHIVFDDGSSFPVAVSLHLPSKQWDAGRCEAASVPAGLVGKTKSEIGLLLIDRALAAGLPRLPVLADAAFGHSGPFRFALEQRGLKYLLDIEHTTAFYAATAPPIQNPRASLAIRDGQHKSAAAWLAGDSWQAQGGKVFRSQVLRPYGEKTRHLYHGQEPATLHVFAERTKRKREVRYSVSNLGTHEALALLGKRWAVERNYRELKQLTGFANYQGRSYAGLMRHLALSAIAHTLLFWITLYKRGVTLYRACRELPAAILLAWHSHCPLCRRQLAGFG